MDKKLLDPYIFKYSSFLDVWTATKREHYNELHSGDEGNVLKSKDINVLQEIIMKTGGDPQKLKTLVGTINFQSDHNF